MFCAIILIVDIWTSSKKQFLHCRNLINNIMGWCENELENEAVQASSAPKELQLLRSHDLPQGLSCNQTWWVIIWNYCNTEHRVLSEDLVKQKLHWQQLKLVKSHHTGDATPIERNESHSGSSKKSSVMDSFMDFASPNTVSWLHPTAQPANVLI